MGRPKKYKTEEERKTAIRERNKRWREANPEKVKEQLKRWYQENAENQREKMKRWYQENREEKLDYQKQWKKNNPDYQNEYRNTPMGRAGYLVSTYQQNDKKYNRGKCTLTAQWIVDNIFTSKCHWCKETDWHKLGCDRIDNDLPHTEDNVVPCCEECNTKRGTMNYEEFLMTIPSGSGR